jgi:cytochrome c oxidase cbb3-type subunit III
MANVDKHDPVQGRIIHEFDGIQEADNGLPGWLTAIFFGSAIFAVGYWFYYEEYGIGAHPGEAYAAQVAERASQVEEITPDMLAAMAADSDTVAQGQAAYATNCAQCHGAKGEGGIGPNLTDSHWLHGGGPTDIHQVVRDGVMDKGMPAWGQVLGGKGVQQVTAFLLTIQDTHVPGKEPQGEEHASR